MRAAYVIVLSTFAVVGTAVVGCGESNAPPYDELSLRDSLRADPRSMETVPAPMKKTLADRYEREANASPEETRIDVQAARLSAQELVQLVDDKRDAANADSFVLAVVELEPGAATAHSPKAPSTDDREEGDELPPLPAVEGEAAPESTRDAEGRALAGRAGRVLRSMLAETGASRVVRVTGWPVGAVVVDETLYVNASWLVSMAALELKGEGPPPPAP
ncbi:MAG TPA: hypothetical protein VM580_14055, partial [Labilithrix sp.]|nr:hypothetical protein [Labilithrix sp.]